MGCCRRLEERAVLERRGWPLRLWPRRRTSRSWMTSRKGLKWTSRSYRSRLTPLLTVSSDLHLHWLGGSVSGNMSAVSSPFTLLRVFIWQNRWWSAVSIDHTDHRGISWQIHIERQHSLEVVVYYPKDSKLCQKTGTYRSRRVERGGVIFWHYLVWRSSAVGWGQQRPNVYSCGSFCPILRC